MNLSRPESVSRMPILFWAMIALSALIPYIQTLFYPFVWDDSVFVVANDRLSPLTPLWRFFTDPETLSVHDSYNAHIYRPLRTILFALLTNTVGKDPLFFHLTSVLLHLGCTLLVVLTIRRLGLSNTAAAIAGCLFGVHPLHVEAVTWISSAGDTLSTLLFLVALYPFFFTRRLFQIVSLTLIFPLALLAKEMSITFPFILLLLFIYRARQSSEPITFRIFLWPLAALAVAILYYLWRSHVLQAFAQDTPGLSHFLLALFRLPVVVLTYVRLLIAPYPLNSFHGGIDLPSLLPWPYPGIALLFLALVAGAVLGFVQKRSESLWLFWFFITLLPVLNFLPLNIHVAERFAYLPSIAFSALCGIGLERLIRSNRRPAIVLLVVILSTFTVMTIMRNSVFDSDLNVSRDQLNQDNPPPAAYWNMAKDLADLGDFRAAIGFLEAAVRKGTRKAHYYNTLCHWYLELGEIEEAKKWAAQSERLYPGNPGAITCKNKLNSIQAMERPASSTVIEQ